MIAIPQLFLIPTPLGKTPANNTIPPEVIKQIHQLDTFFVESVPSARKFLQWVDHPVPEYEWKLYVLNKKTTGKDIAEYLDVIRETGATGMFSEAGSPAVADPGSDLIRKAHQQGIIVTPLSGPSSITLALMASGGNGQQFTFHGYLPRDTAKVKQKITSLERAAVSDGYTHMFMETPHRTPQLWKELLETLNPKTVLGFGQNLTLPNEYTAVREVGEWLAESAQLPAEPAIFFLYRNPELKTQHPKKGSSGKKKGARKKW